METYIYIYIMSNFVFSALPTDDVQSLGIRIFAVIIKFGSRILHRSLTSRHMKAKPHRSIFLIDNWILGALANPWRYPNDYLEFTDDVNYIWIWQTYRCIARIVICLEIYAISRPPFCYSCPKIYLHDNQTTEVLMRMDIDVMYEENRYAISSIYICIYIYIMSNYPIKCRITNAHRPVNQHSIEIDT